MHLITLPLFHSFGSTVQMNAGFAVGATLVLLPRFDAAQGASALLAAGEGHLLRRRARRCTGGCSAPSPTTSTSTTSRRTCASPSPAARAFPVEIIKQFKDRFHVQILEGYGLSETSPLATFADPGRAPRPGSIGVPIWGVECELIDDDWNAVEGTDDASARSRSAATTS